VTTIATILLSYNRPRMLCEALGTIGGCDQLIVTDDGSDFDVYGLIRGCYSKAQFVVADKMTLAERLSMARVGRLVNRALALVECDVVTYLCDDDILYPRWIPTLKAYFDEFPDEHWVRGAWFAFSEDDRTRKPERCRLDPRQLTTGNFAHRIECFRDEGIRWNEETISSHDDSFLWNVHRVHDTYNIPYCNMVAGWRRLHRHNALTYADRSGYTANARILFEHGWLE
jgi:hypothetical protein